MAPDWHHDQHERSNAAIQQISATLMQMSDRIARLEATAKTAGAVWGFVAGLMVTIGAVALPVILK